MNTIAAAVAAVAADQAQHEAELLQDRHDDEAHELAGPMVAGLTPAQQDNDARALRNRAHDLDGHDWHEAERLRALAARFDATAHELADMRDAQRSPFDEDRCDWSCHGCSYCC